MYAIHYHNFLRFHIISLLEIGYSCGEKGLHFNSPTTMDAQQLYWLFLSLSGKFTDIPSNLTVKEGQNIEMACAFQSGTTSVYLEIQWWFIRAPEEPSNSEEEDDDEEVCTSLVPNKRGKSRPCTLQSWLHSGAVLYNPIPHRNLSEFSHDWIIITKSIAPHSLFKIPRLSCKTYCNKLW